VTTRNQVYSCSQCGQIAAVVHAAAGRLVCCGYPMMLAGEKSPPASPGREAQASAATGVGPYWKCSNCKYILQAAAPPERCPSCQEMCQFVDVTCYIPECGMTGSDPRLIA